MTPDLTNLLPESRVRALRREYFVRLGVVMLLLFSSIIVLSGFMLVPAHTFLENEITARERELADLSHNTAAADEAAFEARLTALSVQAKRIQELATVSSASSVLRGALSVAHQGVALSGFTLTSPGKSAGTLTMTGRATTRDNLRRYQLALQNAPFVASANLPVSAYAKESNIDFVITLTLVKP